MIASGKRLDSSLQETSKSVTLMPNEQHLLSDLRENAKTVATSLTKFPTNENQCDTCLRRVESPIMSLDEYTALLHSTDRSRAAVKDFV